MENELNAKQKRFCDKDLLDFNGKQAPIRVGYSAKTAEVQASHLLRILKVKTNIFNQNLRDSSLRNIMKLISARLRFCFI